jgi:glutathione reductase (NADPH)
MRYGLVPKVAGGAVDAAKTTMKVITLGAEEVVVGLHVHGDAADEMLQGFAVAVAA